MLYTWNKQDTVNQLYFNLKKKKKGVVEFPLWLSDNEPN